MEIQKVAKNFKKKVIIYILRVHVEYTCTISIYTDPHTTITYDTCMYNT